MPSCYAKAGYSRSDKNPNEQINPKREMRVYSSSTVHA